jgi:hypothetical protein
MMSFHALASQAFYTARLAEPVASAKYETEVFDQVDRLSIGLAEWELARVKEEVRQRLAARKHNTA